MHLTTATALNLLGIIASKFTAVAVGEIYSADALSKNIFASLAQKESHYAKT